MVNSLVVAALLIGRLIAPFTKTKKDNEFFAKVDGKPGV